MLRPPLDFWGRGSPGRGLPIVSNLGRRFLPFFFVSGSNCYDYAISLRLERQWNDATRPCWLLLPLVGSAMVQGEDPSLQGNERLLSFRKRSSGRGTRVRHAARLVRFSPLLPGHWVCRGGGGVWGRAKQLLPPRGPPPGPRRGLKGPRRASWAACRTLVPRPERKQALFPL